jgi:leader peptidase (prepilin peptidase)/N-methyltransferase
VIETLQESPGLWIGLATLVGMLIGSFLNVVAHRLPKMMERDWRAQCADILPNCAPSIAVDGLPPVYNLVVPRSACPNCARPIQALENVPVISYLILGGRCKGCRQKISVRYPVVELITGVLTGLVAWRLGFGAQGVAACVLVWALVALTLIDFDTQLLPDSITQPLLWLGLLVNSFGVFTDLRSSLIGAVAGYLILWSVYWLFKLITKKEGMGYGDFKLLAALGAWLGWKSLPIIILLSSVVGAAVGICLIFLARRGRDVPIPFGPYLAGGGLIALLGGQSILDWYLNSL